MQCGDVRHMWKHWRFAARSPERSEGRRAADRPVFHVEHYTGLVLTLVQCCVTVGALVATGATEMTGRMTRQSRENLRQAQYCELVPVEGCRQWYIKLVRGDRVGFVSGGDGLVMLYSFDGAKRAIGRVRPDLAATLGDPIPF